MPRVWNEPRSVPDWETGRVALVLPTAAMYVYNENLAALELFYADFAREIARYDDVCCLVPDEASAEKMARLTGLEIDAFPPVPIPDIWIRDFAPIPTTGGYVKFRYDPPYAPKKVSRLVEAAFRHHLSSEGIALDDAGIRLDGGTIVHNGECVGVATSRVFSWNRGQPREELLERLRRALALERLVIVPSEPEDRTGHADGMLRWFDPNTLAVNDYGDTEVHGRFRERLAAALEEQLPGVEQIELPYPCPSERLRGWYGARGNYVNFLMTRNRVYAPVYGIEEDRRAREIFETVFPGRVSYVDASAISRYGGSLNCISWNLL